MIKRIIKKAAALFFCVSMLSGLSISAVGSINAYANATSALSLSAYASKDDLENKFAADSGNIGKLKFGKNSTGGVQEWYILGSDSGVVDSEGKVIDNTVIFAASNMTGILAFQMGYKWWGGTHIYNGDRSIESAEVTYEDSKPRAFFYSNHYGLSDARNTLREMGTGSNSYFTSKEQELMNKTTVKTEDLFKTDSSPAGTYTTSDKLYLPYGNKGTNNQIYIGSDDSKKLDYSNYWNTGVSFWLRTPYSSSDSLEFCANPGGGISSNYVDCVLYYGLRPASNLNLTNVLFASAATAASSNTPEAGSITAGEAMTLRLDGEKLDEENKNIGSVSVSGDTISVTRGSSDKTVSLVVQGKLKVNDNDETDWYYSEAITEEKKINKTDIESKLSNIISSASIDLSSCKIWIEITGDDDMLYAVEATHTHTYDSTWTSNETDHWHQCTPSDACDDLPGSIKDKDGNIFNENGHCTVCDYDVSVDAWEYKEPVAATCMDSGREEYWIYNVNGNIKMYRFTGEYDTPAVGVKLKKLEKFTGMEEIITDDDPDNHVNQSDNKAYEKEYVKVDASTHKILCSGCKAELGTAPHIFYDDEMCTECGYNASNGFVHHPELKATCKHFGNDEYWEYTVGDKTTYYQEDSETILGLRGAGVRKLATVSNAPIYPIDPDNHVYYDEQSDDYKAYEKEYVKVDASTHKILCSGCDAELGTAAHDLGGNKCKDCGYTKSSNNSSGGGLSSSSESSNAKWIKDGKGWKCMYLDGTYAKGTTITDADGNKIEKVLWLRAGNSHFAFSSDGYLVTGWIYDRLEDKWYYCDENAGKLYGWFYSTADGYWYYLSPSTGEALTGWHSINGNDYYFAAAPSAPTYSFDASTDTWIYSNLNGVRPFGSMYANTVTPDNYRVDANGAWIH